MPSSEESPASTRLILNVLVCVWTLLLLGFSLIDRAPSHALQTPWVFYHLAWCLLPWLWLALRQLSGSPLRCFGGMADVGLVVFGVLQVLSSALSSRPLFTLMNLPLALAPLGIAYGALNLLGTDAERSGRQRLLERGGILFTLLFSLVSLGFWIHHSLVPWSTSGEGLSSLLGSRNSWPLGHSNFTANLCVIGLLWALGLLSSESRHWKLLALLSLFSCSLGLLTSGSRAGLLALAAGALVWTLGRLTAFSGRTRLLAYCLAGLLGCLALLAVLRPETLTWLGLGRSRGDFSTSDLQRRGMVATGLRMLSEAPYLGQGPGLLPQAYLRLRVDQVGATDSVQQLHSTPLQIAAESGLPALLAALLVLGCILRHRAHRGLLPAAAGLLVYSLFDYQGDLPALATLAAVIATLQLRPAPSTSGTTGSPRLGGVLLLGLLGFWLLLVSPALRARNEFGSAMNAFFAGNATAFAQHCAEARRLDPREPFYPLVQAQLLADPTGHGAPLGTIPASPTQALAAYDACLLIDPAQETAHFNRAWLLLGTHPQEAEKSFRQAAALSPTRGSVHRGLGLSLLLQGRRDEALQAFAREIANNPAHAVSPLWTEPLLAPLAAPARKEAMQLLTRTAVLAESLERTPEATSARYTAGILHWLDHPEAPLPLEYASKKQAELLAWLQDGRATTHPLSLASQNTSDTQSLQLLESLLGPGPLPAEVLKALRKGDRRSLLLPGGLPANTSLLRYQRLGYGLTMHNLDAPLLSDLCVTPENTVLKSCLAGLFPTRAHLGASLLAQAAQEAHP